LSTDTTCADTSYSLIVVFSWREKTRAIPMCTQTTKICLSLTCINFHGFVMWHLNGSLDPNLMVYTSMLWLLLLILHIPVCIGVLGVVNIIFFQSFVAGPEDSVAFIDGTMFQTGKDLWSTQSTVESEQGRRVRANPTKWLLRSACKQQSIICPAEHV